MLSLLQSSKNEKSKTNIRNSIQPYNNNSNGLLAPPPSSTNTGNILPPKTVRQIKQRSVERQHTSSSILSLPKQPSTKTNQIDSCAFGEQTKSSLRKMSNSVQSLHNSDENKESNKNKSKLKANDSNSSKTKVLEDNLEKSNSTEILLIDQVKKLKKSFLRQGI
jgi:hypothetical protein